MNIPSLVQISAISGDLRPVIFPAALVVYYLICWLLVGRNRKIENVTTQYEAPPGITPGVARYVMTGGSDGTTLAAILTSLAARRIIFIQPEHAVFHLTLLNDTARVMPEEAAALKSLLGVELPVAPYPATNTAIPADVRSPYQKRAPMFGEAFGDDVLEASRGTVAPHVPGAGSNTVLDPQSPEINVVLGAVQDAFRKNLQGIYFRWNLRFVGVGMIATFVWAMVFAFRLNTPDRPQVFLTFWLLMFTSISGVVIAAVLPARPGHPTPAQRIKTLLLPILFFLVPGLVIYSTLPTAHVFIVALLAAVALNNIFLVLMRAPTPEGRRVLQQLAGFREFLMRTEQDRLNRINTPSQNPEVLDRFLPYAIALNVREGWGDALAAAFSNAVIER